jgi:hypothetical protein
MLRPTFRRKISGPSSRSKSTPSEKPEEAGGKFEGRNKERREGEGNLLLSSEKERETFPQFVP